MAAPSKALLLALLLLAAAPAPAAEVHGGEPGGGLRGGAQGRRLYSWAQEQETIWGRCDVLDRQMTGCSMKGASQCSDRLSDGPQDADVEIALGNLPASSAAEQVHLQWWAARRSPSKYSPLTSPVGVAVYRNMTHAYPKFFEPAFNGGNVRVSEAGQATIRVRAPSTYFVWPFLAIPHIHLRLCRNTSFIENVSDSVNFGISDTWVITGSQPTAFQILAARPYVPGPNVSFPNASREPQLVDWRSLSPRPVGYICSVSGSAGRTTTLAPGSTTLAATTATTTSTKTSTATSTATSLGQSLESLSLNATRDALDLAALEFSPVYTCLMEGQFFDQFSSGCTSSCPVRAALEKGQCVLPEKQQTVATLEVAWRLKVACVDSCGFDMSNVTLHKIRLAVAGHLDIPFQEVTGVVLSWTASTARRLLVEQKTLSMDITAVTKRISKADGEALLESFIGTPAFAAKLLNQPVVEVLSMQKGPTGQLSSDVAKIGAGTDPYTPAYEAVTPAQRFVPVAADPLGMLPVGAAVGIAAGVVVLGAMFGGFLFFQRRRRRQRQEQARAVEAKSKKLESNSPEEADDNPKKAGAPTEGLATI